MVKVFEKNSRVFPSSCSRGYLPVLQSKLNFLRHIINEQDIHPNEKLISHRTEKYNLGLTVDFEPT